MRKGKPKTPKKLDLAIEVKNFGPVSKGKVALKNLTVLIGPNNSGKSYIAMLVHAFAESYNQRVGNTVYDKQTIQTLIKYLPELEKMLISFSGSINEELEIPTAISSKIINKLHNETNTGNRRSRFHWLASM